MTRWIHLPLLLLACSPLPDQQCNPTSNINTAGEVVLISLTGQPTEVELVAPPTVICASGNPVARDVLTEVLDGNNQPVENTHGQPVSDSTGFRTVVRFTPTTPGTYYLTARFEPALGVAQRQHLVVRDRAAEVPVSVDRVPSDCEAVHPLGDRLLCRRTFQVRHLRDGGDVAPPEVAMGLDSVGGVVWLWSATTVSRLTVEDGGVARADLAVPPLDTFATAVTPGHFAQDTDTGVLHVYADGGGLSSRFDPFPLRALGPGVALDGEVLGWMAGDGPCATGRDGGPHCVRSASTALSAEEGVLWLREGESQQLAQWRVFADGRSPEYRVISHVSPLVSDNTSRRPFFTWAGRVLTMRADDLTLEAWAPQLFTLRVTTTPTHVVFIRNSQAIVYRR